MVNENDHGGRNGYISYIEVPQDEQAKRSKLVRRQDNKRHGVL